MRCEHGPLAATKSSELWASVSKVVYDGVILGLCGFRTRGPY